MENRVVVGLEEFVSVEIRCNRKTATGGCSGVVLLTAAHVNTPNIAPRIACPECGKVMSGDGLKDAEELRVLLHALGQYAKSPAASPRVHLVYEVEE